MIMTSGSIKLRPLELSDSKTLVEYLNNEEVKEFVGLFYPVNNFLEEEWIKRNAINHNNIVLGIEYEGKLIGTVGFHNIEWIIRSAEFGIAIYNPNFWNKGIGTIVTKLMLKYGFEYLNLNRIWLTVFENNTRAIHVYEKCGFIQEGRKRQGRYYKGHYWDVILMSILS
ncbi:MAG: GNAT family N-acetyltransferase, partial [Fervidobacterium sp.]